MSKTNMDCNYHLEKNKYIKRQIHITCSRLPPTLQKMGPHNEIEFADFGVYKAWQFSKYNVRELLTLRLKHLWARIRSKRCEAQPLTTLASPN